METKGKMMITCKEATYLISKKQQDKLSFLEKMQLKFHLMMCVYCRRFNVQINFMSKAIARMKRKIEQHSVEIQLTDEQKQRMQQKIREQQK